MASIAAPADLSPAARRHRFAQRGLRSALLGVAIGLLLTIAIGSGLVSNLVQSICISMACWLTIDLLRVPLARWHHRNAAPGTPEALSQWPGWPLMVVAIVVGTVIGFSTGNALANLLLDRSAPGYYRGNWRQMVALLLGSLVPGTLVTYWFYSRETIAAKEAAIQTALRQAAEHRLKLIESQLEPHMLFNTLATLRVLIGTDPARAQAMLDQLIAFLRATLAGSRAAQHPLRDEFARLGDYLALMQLRMGARLQTRFELPEALAALPVPPLLLQPLVENSIKHGLEPAVAGGRIEVSAARDGGTLLLRVRDTGVGLSDSVASANGFGVTQVRERLAALHGAQASLTLAAADDTEGGTLATVRLPIGATETETSAR
ncbi:MAG TPA: histidine kinase [Burkholderiaceae bacterium]|nr:histidine kinase [Burkholderiaceae bacterium]